MQAATAAQKNIRRKEARINVPPQLPAFFIAVRIAMLQFEAKIISTHLKSRIRRFRIALNHSCQAPPEECISSPIVEWKRRNEQRKALRSLRVDFPLNSVG
jgi:hypothetical protein